MPKWPYQRGGLFKGQALCNGRLVHVRTYVRMYPVDVYVYQNKALYQLELNGPPVNITCTHSCKQDEETHPILTIQMPGDDYKHYKLHSKPLRSRFLSHHNITSLVDMELYDESPCYTNGSRSYHLELSSINTTLLNNSVIHCGVTWSNADETCMHNFFADGISYLVMPANDTESDTDLMCMTSPPPSSTSAEIVPSRATTSDLTTTTTTCVLTTTEMIYITPSSLPTETSITNTLGVGMYVCVCVYLTRNLRGSPQPMEK